MTAMTLLHCMTCMAKDKKSWRKMMPRSFRHEDGSGHGETRLCNCGQVEPDSERGRHLCSINTSLRISRCLVSSRIVSQTMFIRPVPVVGLQKLLLCNLTVNSFQRRTKCSISMCGSQGGLWSAPKQVVCTSMPVAYSGVCTGGRRSSIP